MKKDDCRMRIIKVSRRKLLKQTIRLQSAKSWLPKYAGKQIVKGYANRYGVDPLCALRELEMLGIKLESCYQEKVKASFAARCEHRRKRRELRATAEKALPHDSDEHYVFIAGYTSWGFAYGITWDDWEKLEIV